MSAGTEISQRSCPQALMRLMVDSLDNAPLAIESSKRDHFRAEAAAAALMSYVDESLSRIAIEPCAGQHSHTPGFRIFIDKADPIRHVAQLALWDSARQRVAASSNLLILDR